jgi:hypothetical protein
MCRGARTKPAAKFQSTDNTRSRTKLQAVIHFVEFVILETVSVLVAGIAVPNLLWSHAAAGHALVAGPIRNLSIAGIAFWYKYENVEFAILGALLGSALAWALYAPDKFTDKPTFAHMLPSVFSRVKNTGESTSAG